MPIIDLNVPRFSNKWINCPFYQSIWKKSEFKWWVYPLDNWIWRRTASSPKIQGHNNIPSLSVPSVIYKKKWRTSTGAEAFSLLVCLDTSKFLLLCLYGYAFSDDPPPPPQELVQNHCPRMQKVHFRLTCVPQKRLPRQDKTRRNEMRRDDTRQDRTGQDKTRQDRTGQ